MVQIKKKSLNEFVEIFYEILPSFRHLDCFLRGLSFYRFFLENLPERNYRITFCGSLEQLQTATESCGIQLIGELNKASKPIFLYEIQTQEGCFEIEHFRTVDNLEDFLVKRPFGFQHSLYSLRLEEEIGAPQGDISLNFNSSLSIEQCPEDLMDLLRVCLCKQKVPSQILGPELMPEIPSDSEALHLLLNEWIIDYRVGFIIDDLKYFNCLPDVCKDLLVKSLAGVRWFEQNQSLIEQIFALCFPDQEVSNCKASFFMCMSYAVELETFKFSEKKEFAYLVDETQDWWLSRLQGESLNVGLIEAWIQKFRHQYKLALFCSCLITLNKHKNSVWLNLENSFSRISEIILELNVEEDRVNSELERYLSNKLDCDLQIKVLIESWGGRLRTRKHWRNFLGLN